MQHSNPGALEKTIGKILTLGFAALFLVFLILTANESLFLAGKLLLFSAIPFFLIAPLRRLIGAARPYQKEQSAPPRKGTNDSFPSRHTYSAFFIATLLFRLSAILSYCLFPAAILLAVIRVRLSLHYPKDTVAGAFLGVLAAILVLILLN